MHIRNKSFSIIVLLTALCLIYMYSILTLVTSWGPNANYSNVSVRTTVNVTQSVPEILNVTCNSAQAVTLTPGGTKQVLCSISIMDYNGGDTINNTNGTFYYYLNFSSDPNDNNTHYTNSTCSETAVNGFNVTWNCTFDVRYYANNGTWIGNFTVKDDYNLTASYVRNVTINSLIALNVTDTINFGNMAVGDTTLLGSPIQANITNFGNRNINITIYGFGGQIENATTLALAMICEYRNITIANERYNLSSAATYDEMTSVTGISTKIPGLTVLQQTNDTLPEVNSTYWRLHVNATTNPFGVCNGTVVFAAIIT